MRKENAKVVTKFISEPGRHLHNDDYFAFVELDFFACYVMADGLDEQNLESARIATEIIISNFMHSPSMKRGAMQRLLKLANKELLSASKSGPLRASVTIVLSDYRKFRYGIAGNTRLLHLRGNAIVEESQDLSLSQKQFVEGKIPKDKLAKHIERNNLSTYLGKNKGFDPFISGKRKIKDGDILVLRTRGFWEQVDSGEILDASIEAPLPEDLTDAAEEMLLAKQFEQGNEIDNYSIAVILFEKKYEDAGKRKRNIKIIKIVLIVFIVILFLLAIFLIARHIVRNNWSKSMNQHMTVALQNIEDENFPRAKDEYANALEFANKLNDTGSQTDITRLQRVAENVMLADSNLSNGQYAKALKKYDEMLLWSYLPDSLAQGYLQSQRQIALAAMEIYDLLAQGDDMRTNGHIDAALTYYRMARRKTTSLYLTDLKKDCESKIAEAELEKAEQNKQAAEEAEKAKAEEEERVKRDQKALGLEMEAEGDKAYKNKEYAQAYDLYLMAQEYFNAAGESDLASQIQKKIDRAEERNMTALVDKGFEYEVAGDSAYAMGNYAEAKAQYQIALEKYTVAEDTTRMISVQRKIDALDTLP